MLPWMLNSPHDTNIYLDIHLNEQHESKILIHSTSRQTFIMITEYLGISMTKYLF
jgi:hypothetical protein